MDGKSLDITQERINKLKQILPDAFTEGKIDWEKLQASLGENIEFKNERYVLNWAGKSDAFRVLQSPTTATLVPCKEESISFDDTENIFIEGENLEVLKVLQKSYFGKIKMIYIDPPYNTGNDKFIYPDKFSETRDEYLSRIGDRDETGYMTREGLFRTNSKDSGHYHSNWLSMMYPRLFLARNLLREEDGVIFVSIDDNEVHNLRLLMNEIFGEENFIAIFPWRKRTAKSDVPFGVSQDYEWIMGYSREKYDAGREIDRKYYRSDDFSEGWRLSDLTTQRSKEERPNSFFDLINPRDNKKYPANPKRVWGVTKDTVSDYLKRNKIVFPGDYSFLNITKPAYRVFESEDKNKNLAKFGSEEARTPISTMLPETIGRTEDGTKEIDRLFDMKLFPFPKPSSLIKHFINADNSKEGIILDFFAGSGTTAHPFEMDEVHNGYFSKDNKGKWKDTTGKSEADDDTFKLIMRNKEQLLDINEPLRFIFSHSALREGWDSPNVFQICTLNETKSELKKRQEIGRGMRLPVDMSGNRIQDSTINRLTVIANESYDDFARQLQSEIEEDCGVSFKGRIKNKHDRETVKYRKGFELNEKFKDIWDRIKYNTSYKVEYETSELIDKAIKAVYQMPIIKKASIKTTKTALQFNDFGIIADPKSSYTTSLDGIFKIPDVLFYIQERTELTRSTILEILKGSGRLGDMLINPQLFLDNAVVAIKDVLYELMIDGIKYEKIGAKEYEMRLFEDYPIHINDLTFKVSKQEKTIYINLIPLDSNVEYDFAKECESRDDIEFYFKLPFWFKIKTPIGNYNPDWALIKKNEKTVYFVAETKSAGQELKISEMKKIKCGEAHFDEIDDVEFKRVATVGELN